MILEKKKTCYIVDVACPFDTKIDESKRTKINKYTDLRYELLKFWQEEVNKVLIIPIIIGTLGSVTNNVKGNMAKLEINITVETL